MMVSAHRFRSIGWIAMLLVCAALVMVLAFRVNALRSQVHRTEQQIIALRKEKLYLETEVETRANQQQLKLWTDVEFGYVAPTASQYLSSERQLAAFAKPDGPDAPAPIRVASADDAVAAEAAFPSIVSSLAEISAPTSRAEAPGDGKEADGAKDEEHKAPTDRAAAAAGLGARLATVGPVHKTAPGKGTGEKTSDRKAGLVKPASEKSTSARDDAARPGKGAKLAAGGAKDKPGKGGASPAKAVKASGKAVAKSTKPGKSNP